MDLDTFHELLTPSGQSVLKTALCLDPDEKTLLHCLHRLQKEHPANLSRAALAIAMLRQKGKLKFQRAEQMYFTREALEQASSEVVSSYRAQRFAAFSRVGDLGCGIGGDTIGLAGQDLQVTAVDLDPVRLAMARCNIEAYGGLERVSFIIEDLLTMPLHDLEAAFFDPGRRKDERRTISMKECQPPLEAVRARLGDRFPLGVKLAPATPWHELDRYDGEVEFISLKGELKECVLWLGGLGEVRRRATVLPGRHSMAAESMAPPLPIVAPRRYLYDPDPAITRAGLVSNLGGEIHANLIDFDIAYLTSDHLQETPFARVVEIDDAVPFQRKRLAEHLRKIGVGRVEIRKRGSAVDGDELVRSMKLSGSEGRVVVLTRAQGKPVAMVGRAV